MKELQDILSAVQDETTLEGGVNALLKGVKSQINENVFQSVILPGDVKLKFNEIFEALEANKSRVVAVLQANVKPVAAQPQPEPQPETSTPTQPEKAPEPTQPSPESPGPEQAPEPKTTEASIPGVGQGERPQPTFAESTL